MNNLLLKVIIYTNKTTKATIDAIALDVQSQISLLTSADISYKVAIQGVLVTDKAVTQSQISAEELAYLPDLTSLVTNFNSSIKEISNSLTNESGKSIKETFMLDFQNSAQKLATLVAHLAHDNDNNYKTIFPIICERLEDHFNGKVNIFLLESNLRYMTLNKLSLETISTKGFDSVVYINTSLDQLKSILDKTKSKKSDNTAPSTSGSVNNVANSTKKRSKKQLVSKDVSGNIDHDVVSANVKQDFEDLNNQ